MAEDFQPRCVERTSRLPETLVYFSPNARDPTRRRTCMCTLQLWRSTANKATCPALDGANVLRMVKLSWKLQSRSPSGTAMQTIR